MLGLPPVYPGIQPPADLVGDVSYPTKPEDFKNVIEEKDGGLTLIIE